MAPRAGHLVAGHLSVPGGGPPVEWPLHSGLWRSLVSASVWGTEGPEFKSRQPDQQEPKVGAGLLGLDQTSIRTTPALTSTWVGLTFGPTGLTKFAWVHKRPESFGIGTEIDD